MAQGKTSILEAFYFVIDGKKADGMNVGGEIYSQYAKVKTRIVEVELKLTKILNFADVARVQKKRKRCIVSIFMRNINTTFFIY